MGEFYVNHTSIKLFTKKRNQNQHPQHLYLCPTYFELPLSSSGILRSFPRAHKHGSHCQVVPTVHLPCLGACCSLAETQAESVTRAWLTKPCPQGAPSSGKFSYHTAPLLVSSQEIIQSLMQADPS